MRFSGSVQSGQAARHEVGRSEVHSCRLSTLYTPLHGRRSKGGRSYFLLCRILTQAIRITRTPSRRSCSVEIRRVRKCGRDRYDLIHRKHEVSGMSLDKSVRHVFGPSRGPAARKAAARISSSPNDDASNSHNSDAVLSLLLCRNMARVSGHKCGRARSIRTSSRPFS
jgi:hypothetical protein